MRALQLQLIELLTAKVRILMTQLRNQTVYQTALSYLGTDVTPADHIDDVVACAEVVTTILRHHVNMPIIAGTYTLMEYLDRSPEFRRVTVPMPGTIIMSATGTGNGRIRGHVGICGPNGTILSNDSYTGKLMAHYSLATWKQRYEQYGGIPTVLYSLV